MAQGCAHFIGHRRCAQFHALALFCLQAMQLGVNAAVVTNNGGHQHQHCQRQKLRQKIVRAYLRPEHAFLSQKDRSTMTRQSDREVMAMPLARQYPLCSVMKAMSLSRYSVVCLLCPRNFRGGNLVLSAGIGHLLSFLTDTDCRDRSDSWMNVIHIAALLQQMPT